MKVKRLAARQRWEEPGHRRDVRDVPAFPLAVSIGEDITDTEARLYTGLTTTGDPTEQMAVVVYGTDRAETFHRASLLRAAQPLYDAAERVLQEIAEGTRLSNLSPCVIRLGAAVEISRAARMLRGGRANG